MSAVRITERACGLLSPAPKFLIHRSGEDRVWELGELRICMSNMQGKLPGHAAAAAAGRNHTQETLDVAVFSI